MELFSIKNETFLKKGVEIIRNQGEILIMVRYPYQAGNKDFFIINSEKDFLNFLNQRAVKESITIFKSFENVKEGLVDKEFISKTLIELDKPKHTDWIVLFPEDKDKAGNWCYDETKEELEESLRLGEGDYVRILEDPDWLNEELIFHAYVPDEDGKVRPGSY